MSFVNKIKGWGQKGATPTTSALDSDVAVADDYRPRTRPRRVAPPPTCRSPTSRPPPRSTPMPQARRRRRADAVDHLGGDAVRDRRLHRDPPAGRRHRRGAARRRLPLIGKRPGRRAAADPARDPRPRPGRPDRPDGLCRSSSAGRGSAQVGASGQALMQSQRLAKSVSQALIGNPTAFPEVKESAEVLASNVRSLKNGEAVAAAPSGVQDALDAAVPLVDRAEKSAGVVVAQQKALTEVGQSLRAINRQSVDLLESAEAILSLKLQRDTSPTEVSALGQLVMLTQRIGKSANEFLTAEGVNPEAVFLLEQGPELVQRDHQGPARRQPADGPARHARPAGARAPDRAHQAVPGDAHARRRHPRQPRRPERRARGADRDRRRQRTAAQGPRDGAGPARQRDRLQRPDPAPAAAVRGPGRPRRRRLPAPVRHRAGPARARWRRTGASRPRARRRKPSASTTPTRRPFCD